MKVVKIHFFKIIITVKRGGKIFTEFIIEKQKTEIIKIKIIRMRD